VIPALFKMLDKPVSPKAPNFLWSEALYLGRINSYALASSDVVANIVKMAEAMQKVRDHYKRPFVVTSWYRPLAYNQKVIAGASKSWHTQGLAVDFIIQGVDCEEVKRFLQTQEGRAIWPYRGEKNTKGWVHLDMGGTEWFNA